MSESEDPDRLSGREITVDDIRVTHLGGLDKPLTDEQLAALGEVDVLMIPVGGVYTLAELVEAYDGAERWLQRVVGERAPSQGWARTVALVSDAAFYDYSVGAQDYSP